MIFDEMTSLPTTRRARIQPGTPSLVSILLLYTELPGLRFTPRLRDRQRRRERRSEPSRHTVWTQTSTGSPDSPRLQIPPDPHLSRAQSSPFDPAIPTHRRH